MAKIVYIRHSESGEIKLGLKEGGELTRLALGTDASAVTEGIAVGDEVEGATLDELVRLDAERRCMKKALSLLAYADNSKRTLYMKLRRAGFSSDCSSACAERCCELGYINEEKQLLRLVAAEANSSLHGRRRIMAKLAARGYSAADISAATDALVASGEVDFEENFSRLVQKYGDGSEETEQKLRYKYGYK